MTFLISIYFCIILIVKIVIIDVLLINDNNNVYEKEKVKIGIHDKKKDQKNTHTYCVLL